MALPEPIIHPADHMGLDDDPAITIHEFHRGTEGNEIHLGVTHNEWIWSHPATHTLVLGPPRSIAGKSTGVQVPAILSAPGPVVVVTTKLDNLDATVLCRARLGTVFHFAPDGESTPEGVNQARWSPIDGCEDWDTAQGVAAALVDLSNINQAARGAATGSDTGHHFAELAKSLIACLFHFAAHDGRDMSWVVDTIAARNADALDALQRQIEALNARAGAIFKGLLYADARYRVSTYDTASVALKAYQLNASLASATDPNFDIDSFVRSEAATIYVTAGTDSQKLTAGIICCFLSQVRKAVYRRHKAMPKAPSVLFALDELAHIAPWPDLPEALAEGGSEGLLVVGALQDLSQAKQRWEDAVGAAFLTIWNNVLVLPGIRDKETLETLSMLCGEWDRPVWGESWPESHSQQASYPSKNLTYIRQRRVMPDEISNGHPQSPDIALALLHGQPPRYIYVTPYYRSAPWTHCIVKSLKHVLRERPELALLPLPELDRDPTRLKHMGLWVDWRMNLEEVKELRAKKLAAVAGK